MEPRLAPVAEVFSLNTDLLLNVADGVTEEHASRRLLPGTNSISYLVAHLVDGRHYVLTLLGRPVANPLAALKEAGSIEQVETLPPLSELRAHWRAVSDHLDAAFEGASAAQLAVASDQRFPVGDPSLLGALAFLSQHESYHVGQAALMRKGLGYPAMTYARPGASR